MTVDDLINALQIPASAQHGQRIPKKYLLENAATSAGDKKLIQTGLEELLWMAVLKPETIAIAGLVDAVRDYREISVLRAEFRPLARGQRLIELIQRAIPYPLVLVTHQAETVTFSLAHKRQSLADTTKVVVEDDILRLSFDTTQPLTAAEQAFLHSLAIHQQTAADLFALYDGWFVRSTALRSAQLTGTFQVAETPALYAQQRATLAEHASLATTLQTLRQNASKEKQLNRRVELNLEIRQVEARLSALSR